MMLLVGCGDDDDEDYDAQKHEDDATLTCERALLCVCNSADGSGDGSGSGGIEHVLREKRELCACVCARSTAFVRSLARTQLQSTRSNSVTAIEPLLTLARRARYYRLNLRLQTTAACAVRSLSTASL